MRRVVRTTVIAAVLAASVTAVVPASASSGRSKVLCSSDTYSCLASTGFTGQSVWGSWGPGHNCVSYAAYRLRANGAAKPWSGAVGDANTWDDMARAAGIRVDHVPAVGAIAQWDTGRYGHVAYVERVTPDSIVISEDAYVSDTVGFSQTRRLSRQGSAFAAANFLHVHDIAAR